MLGLATGIMDAVTSNSPLYYTVGDTIYYPGEIKNVQFYSDADSGFNELTDAGEYSPAADGALLITFKPGFDFVPPKADLSVGGFDSLGHLAVGGMAFEALIQEVNVKRKKKKVLN